MTELLLTLPFVSALACSNDLGTPQGALAGRTNTTTSGADGSVPTPDGSQGVPVQGDEDGLGTAVDVVTDASGQDVAVCVDPSAISDPGPPYSRRLTRTEYDKTVATLLGDTSAPASRFAYSEELNHNFDNNPETLTAPPLLIEDYKDAADALATNALGRLSELLPCDAAAGRTCAEQFIRSFGERAFRRPVTDEDVNRYLGPFDVGSNVSFENGIRLVISAMLQAADFLYRIELGGSPVADGIVRPTSWEMASRLSYFLWNTAPDQELTDAARNAGLETNEAVESQARRMVADPRTREMVSDFHDQWLDLRRVPTLEKDAELFPAFDATVADDMHTEALLLVEDVLFSGAQNYMGLFTASYSFLNANLAEFYGAGSVSTDGFQRVEWDSQRRAGVLTAGGLMSMTAKPNQADPILRGKLVRNQLLCDPPPPPPAGLVIEVPELDDSMTTRERFAAHREDPGCAGCHQLLDPIGFIFETYDAVGRYRETENGIAVDTSGELTNTDIEGPIVGADQLGEALAGSAQVQGCVSTNWFRYAVGRAEVAWDVCTLETLAQRFRDTGFVATELLVALTQTDAFLYRRATTGANQ